MEPLSILLPMSAGKPNQLSKENSVKKPVSRSQYIDDTGHKCEVVVNEVDRDYVYSHGNINPITKMQLDIQYGMEEYDCSNDPKIAQLMRMIRELEIEHEKPSAFQIGSLKGWDIEFGHYNGKPIKWKILRKNNGYVYMISVEELCRKYFHNNNNRESNNWVKSDLRKWLNGEFFESAFTQNEKEKICMVGLDKVTLLTKEEAESLMSKKERANNSNWWLRSAENIFSVCYVDMDGRLRSFFANKYGGVRPVLNIRL